MDFINKLLKLFSFFQSKKESIDEVVGNVQKFQSGVRIKAEFENVKEAQGTFAGTLKISSSKDVELEDVLLSFNQYIYKYIGIGGNRHTWKEYFIGTQNVDGFSLKANETKELNFHIDYEAELREDEKKAVEEKNATIKDIIKGSYFRKKGTGSGTEWKFQLVVVCTLAGGTKVKEIHKVKIG